MIREIRRETRHHFSAEENIRIHLEGLRGEESIAEICRREGIVCSIVLCLWTALPLQVDFELICLAICKHLSGITQ
jgi:hypothetical protein